jgi:hypothetical protein
MIEDYVGLEAQFARLFLEIDDGDAIAEDVVDPVQRGGCGRDIDVGHQEALVVAVPWAKQHAVLAETYGLPVGICGNVAHAQDRHARLTHETGQKCRLHMQGSAVGTG